MAEPVCCNCSDRLRPSTNPPLSCRWLRGFPYSVQFFSFKSPHPLCTLVQPYVAEPVYYCLSYPARPGTALLLPACLGQLATACVQCTQTLDVFTAHKSVETTCNSFCMCFEHLPMHPRPIHNIDVIKPYRKNTVQEVQLNSPIQAIFLLQI